MSFTTDVIFYYTFDSEPILESVNGDFPTVFGSVPTIVAGVFGNAWQMSDSNYILSNDSMSISNQLTIGFWLKPSNPGIVTNPSNNTSTALKMPVISKATVTNNSTSLIFEGYKAGEIITQGLGNFTIPLTNSSTFIIWEETQSDGTNIMKLQINGIKSAVQVQSVIASTPYTSGEFHHFWMVYNGLTNTHILYIDTIQDTGAVQTGTIPTTLNSSSSNFCINNYVPGNDWEVARNTGTIDDLIIFSSVKSSAATIVRAANDGALYVADSSYTDVDEVDQAIIFDDPGTSQITSVYSNRGTLYVSRSDGNLLKGNKLLWENRRDFGNISEQNNLTVINKSADGYVRVSVGSLKIQDSIVRI